MVLWDQPLFWFCGTIVLQGHHTPTEDKGEALDITEMGPVSWVNTQRDLDYLIEQIATAEEVIFDLETTGLAEHAVTGGKVNGGVAARIALASFTVPQKNIDGEWDGAIPTSYVLPLSHKLSPWRGTWRNALRSVFAQILQYSVPLSNQNIKFDAKWMKATCGVDIAHLIAWDTQVGAHLLDENSSTKLKEGVPRDLGVKRWDQDIDFSQPGSAEEIDLFTLGTYAAGDTFWTWAWKRYQQKIMYLREVEEEPHYEDEVIDYRLGRLATWVAMPTVNSLTRIEQNGMRLDVPWVEEALEEDMRIAAESLEKMADLYGQSKAHASAAPTSGWFKQFTQLAVERGDLVVAAMTDGGNPQWSKGVLTRQARQAELNGNMDSVAGLVLRQRKASKRAEFLRAWLGLVTQDGYIYTTYNAGYVNTGRLSSSVPNMQQISKSLRPAFIPREGYHIVDLDFSQIELRVAAQLSQSPPMVQAFQEGADLHRRLAAIMNNIPEDQVTKDERQKAKSANFGLLYGMGAYGFKEYAETSYGVMMTEREAAAVHKAYFDTWKGLRDWHQKQIAQVHAKGYVVSILGRVRRLHGKVWDGNDKMVSYAERAAINAPVQGTASDLLMIAAADIQGLLPGSEAVPNALLSGTVHDSLVAEVKVDTWQDTVEELVSRMENLDHTLSRMGVEFNVPIKADYTCGTRWSYSDIGGEE